jgi:hypothetical protein
MACLYEVSSSVDPLCNHIAVLSLGPVREERRFNYYWTVHYWTVRIAALSQGSQLACLDPYYPIFETLFVPSRNRARKSAVSLITHFPVGIDNAAYAGVRRAVRGTLSARPVQSQRHRSGATNQLSTWRPPLVNACSARYMVKQGEERRQPRIPVRLTLCVLIIVCVVNNSKVGSGTLTEQYLGMSWTM